MRVRDEPLKQPATLAGSLVKDSVIFLISNSLAGVSSVLPLGDDTHQATADDLCRFAHDAVDEFLDRRDVVDQANDHTA
ncbi:hypothetical protein GCM10027419_28420 [Pandoraea terrae]